jgi:hypothetical protein
MGHAVGERSWKYVVSSAICVAVWKWDLRLADRGNSISGRVIRFYRVSVFEGHRLLLTESRWNMRWVSGRGKTCFFNL